MLGTDAPCGSVELGGIDVVLQFDLCLGQGLQSAVQRHGSCLLLGVKLVTLEDAD